VTQIVNYVEFRLLSWFARQNSPLPVRMKTRFAESARKRDPQKRAQAAADRLAIETAGTLRPDFFRRRGDPVQGSGGDALSYLNKAASSVHGRKPEPGFHPLVFAEHHDLGVADPYATFIRMGRPGGPWLQKVIEGGHIRVDPHDGRTLSTALHIHAYFAECLPDIIDRLHRNESRPDLFVTIGSTSTVQEVEHLLSDYRGIVRRIEVVPNAGRDIGSLLTGALPRLIMDYDIVGHVHAKKSLHLVDRDLVAAWTRLLYENLLGGDQSGAILDQILVEFAQDKHLGLIFPDDPNIFGWTTNLHAAEPLARRMGHEILPQHFNFPAGTMFFMRTAVLKNFTDLDLDWADYPVEPIPSDGTMLHALERLIGIIPVLEGWNCAVTNTRGITR
jgi:hypothetical protein